MESTPAPLQRFVGEPRLEDAPLLRGAGRFVDDMTLPRMLHAVVVRSVQAHARIRAIDAAEARAMPGVVSVLTAQDLAGVDNVIPPIPREDIVYDNSPGHPLLADEKVSYVGQPVAVVVAEDFGTAQDAVGLVRADYHPHTPVLDPRLGALDDRPPLH